MLKVARKIISLDSRNAKAYYMQAVIAARADNYDLAKRLLPRLGRFADLPAPMLLSGVVEYETGNVERAIEQFQRLLATQPRNMMVRTLLARALYGNPFLVVLDEPNSNLDSEGDAALNKAILAVRARGGVVVVVAHRPVGIESVDLILVMKDGRVQAFGPKEAVLGQVLQRPVAAPPAIKIVSDKGGAPS